MLLMVSWISKMMKYLVSALSLTYLFLSTSLGMGENKLIDDFSNESQNRWQFFTDQVMGGISEGNASLVSDKSGQYVRLEGSVSTANNGGFIQIRTDINEGTNEAKGIIIKAKKCNIPIFTTYNGADRIDSSDPNYFGRPNTWGQRYSNILFHKEKKG